MKKPFLLNMRVLDQVWYSYDNRTYISYTLWASLKNRKYYGVLFFLTEFIIPHKSD